MLQPKDKSTQTSRPIAEDLIWEIDEIAREIGQTRRQVYHMAEQGLIPVRKIGARYVASRRALRSFFHDLVEVA